MHEVMLGGLPRPRDFALRDERLKKIKKGDIVKTYADLDPLDGYPKEGDKGFRILHPNAWWTAVSVTYYSNLGRVTKDELEEVQKKDPCTAP